MKTISSLRSKLLALTLALMASVSTFAYDFQSGYLFYNILPDGTVAVTSETYGIPYDYLPHSLVIPSEVNGYNGETYVVTEIANYAFSGCSMLDTLVIPNTVKKIGMYAFTGCTKLVYISFPESIEDILGGALYECAWYNNQPDGLIYIGNLLYRYKGTAPTGTIVVKDGTKAILDFTFSNQPNIQSVVLPESVTSIHIQAFGDCPNLESVVLPSKLETIEDHTFQYCEKLTNIKLPDALKLIGKNAFIGCTNLTKLTLPSSVQIIEDEAFANCTSLTEVTCYATIPPVRGDVVSDSPSDWFFAGVDVAKIPLYVPTESIDLYKKAEQWMFFNPILPIEPTTDYKSQWCDTWNVMWFDGMYFDETASTTKYRLGKDTIIGDYTYSKFTSSTSVRFTDDRKVYVYYEGFDNNDPYSEDLPTGEYLAYDFSAQVGDTLEVFSGVTYNTKTYKCVVYDVQTDPETNLRTIMLHPLRVVDGNGNVEVSSEEITWIEGVGSPRGFLINTTRPGGGLFTLLCAYKDDELKYTGSFYERFGCEYNAGVVSDDLFPTLSGLQRTICREYCEQADNKTRIEQFTNLTTRTETGGPYLYCSPFLLREEDNKILIYSRSLNKDLVLYDFNLQVGDSLPMLYIDFFAKDDWIPDSDMKIWCVVDYHKDLEGNILPADTLIVTDISAITLLDGKEYKKWTFDNGMEYVEGIGSFGNDQWSGDFFQLIGNMDIPVSLHGEHLVCASRNGKLLYQMDDAEMERLGTECLCEVEKKWSDTWCDTWNIMEHNVQLIGDYNEETWRHYLAEDTTINGTTYTTVNRYWTADKTKRGFVATIRFTEDQKVYALLGNTEYLVYDFSVQVGDTIETIVGVNCGTMLQRLLVHQVDIDDATNRKTITLYPLCKLEEDVDCDRCDENGYYLDLFPIQWIEGVGSTDGFLMGDRPCSDWVGGIGHKLLCAYKDDELQYINDLYQDDYGCEYNAVGQNPENLFPTLWGLQQTICSGYYGEEGDEWASGLTGPSQEITMMDGKPYLQWGSWYLREENDKILVYSEIQKKDLVLYDFTLELGDTLTTLNMVTPEFLEYEGIVGIVDYPLSDYEYTYPIDTLVVTELSKETLLDGKEYTRWKFSDGTVYVEGIGSMSETFFHHIADHLPVPVSYLGSYLVCVSKNNKLLYQMDDAEMERLGAECLCDYDSGHRKDNAKDGQIGGRPTPTQWNQLEVVLREMDNNHTILQAETFSYTLEDISQQVNNKTYFQLARQSTKDTATTKSVVGALHFGKDEDNRVYFLRDGVEYVLYDFTAEPGDTVEIFAGINNYPQETTYTHVVTGKDTLENGACRMLLEVVFPDETNTTAENAEKVWLAGLGSVDGIVHNAAKRTSNAHAAPSRTAHSNDTQTSVMLCAWREDSCLYTTDHPDYDSFGCVYNQDPTSIEDTHSPSPIADYQKLLHNGQLLIIHNGKTYNVLGIAVE